MWSSNGLTKVEASSVVVEHRPKRRLVGSAAPDIIEAASAVSETVMLAAYDASQKLTELGIPHAVIGGLAVGAYGAPRATKDIDFIVFEKDAFDGTTILSFKQGVPIAVRGVVVDYLTVEGNEHPELFRQAVRMAQKSEGIPVIDLGPLVVLKLQTARRQDIADVERLLEQVDRAREVTAFVKREAPELLPRLDMALNEGKP